jgi:hypothetical protein
LSPLVGSSDWAWMRRAWCSLVWDLDPATGVALDMPPLLATGERSDAPRPLGAFEGRAIPASQEAVVTDNFGNHDNCRKLPSARKVHWGLLLCPP